jgi:DNA-binding MarR family transcriptional regulator
VLVRLTPEGRAQAERVERAYEELEPELRRLLQDVT